MRIIYFVVDKEIVSFNRKFLTIQPLVSEFMTQTWELLLSFLSTLRCVLKA